MAGISVGNGGYSISASNGLEDSSIAIALLVSASWHESAMPPALSRDYGAEFVPFAERRMRVVESSLEAVAVLGSGILNRDGRRDINPFAATFFAEAILRRLGIRTAESRIVAADEAKKLPANFVVKFEERRRLRWAGTMPVHVPYQGRWALVSAVVPDSASVDFVRRKKLGIEDFGRDEMLSLLTGKLDDGRLLRRVLQALSKQCRGSDSLFVGFEPTDEEWPGIKAAMDIYGDAYLRIAAARIFIGCTAPHFANVLVSRSGELVSIDHDSARFENGEDLRMLFKFVRRGSRAFQLLSEVAALSEDDVRAAVAGIPKHPASGSLDGLAEYFVERLRLWRSLYEAAPTRAAAQAV